MVGHGTNIMDLKHMVYLLRLYDNVHKRFCGTFATEDLQYMVYLLHQYDSVH